MNMQANCNSGSVLQALQGLNQSSPPGETQPVSSGQPSPAFLPARPGKTSRCVEGTGVIDVRALAAIRRLRGQAPFATGPVGGCSPPTATSPSTTPSLCSTGQQQGLYVLSMADDVPRSSPVVASPSMQAESSLWFLQVRAFVLGALCASLLLGSIFVRVVPHQDALSWPAHKNEITVGRPDRGFDE